jgi:hypothetical protein
MRPSGRDFPLQPHLGVNRIANWSPSTGTTVNTEGLPITSVGTVSTPTLAATNLAASMRRWLRDNGQPSPFRLRIVAVRRPGEYDQDEGRAQAERGAPT